MSNPQIPNPDQLEFIHPKANPKTNAARYEEPTEELKAQNPTVIIGPNATYLVQPGYWEEKAEDIAEGGGVKPPEPEESQEPQLFSLDPSELPVWAQDTEVLFNGENFTITSQIIWNGNPEPTTFVDDHNLKTLVKPSTVQVPAPFTVQAWVKEGEKETTKLDFTFIT